jgi:hypothetical protein
VAYYSPARFFKPDILDRELFKFNEVNRTWDMNMGHEHGDMNMGHTDFPEPSAMAAALAAFQW